MAVSRKPHHGERSFDHGFEVLARQPELLWTKGHIFFDGRAEELVVGILKQKSNLASHRFEIRRCDGLARDANRSVAGDLLGQDSVQVQKQGGFARTVGAKQPYAFARRDAEAHAAQGFGPVVVAVAQAFDLNGSAHFHPRAHMAAQIRSARSEARTKSCPTTVPSRCQRTRRWCRKVRLARARRMRSDSSSSTKRYRCISASVVTSKGGTWALRSTPKIFPKGVVFASSTTVRRQIPLLAASASQLP